MSSVKVTKSELAEIFESTRAGGIDSLVEMQQERYRPLFAHELVDAALNASPQSLLWQQWYTTASIAAIGDTVHDNKVVAYAHLPNYLTEPETLDQASSKMKNGAGKIPEEKFQKMVDLEGVTDQFGNQLVWVKDYHEIISNGHGPMPVEEAIEHPQTVPVLGGRERAEAYLETYRERCGEEIEVLHDDKPYDDARARLLIVGPGLGVNADIDLRAGARFLAVRDKGPRADISQEYVRNVLQDYLKPKTMLEEATEVLHGENDRGKISDCLSGLIAYRPAREEAAERLANLDG